MHKQIVTSLHRYIVTLWCRELRAVRLQLKKVSLLTHERLDAESVTAVRVAVAVYRPEVRVHRSFHETPDRLDSGTSDVTASFNNWRRIDTPNKTCNANIVFTSNSNVFDY